MKHTTTITLVIGWDEENGGDPKDFNWPELLHYMDVEYVYVHKNTTTRYFTNKEHGA